MEKNQAIQDYVKDVKTKKNRIESVSLICKGDFTNDIICDICKNQQPDVYKECIEMTNACDNKNHKLPL